MVTGVSTRRLSGAVLRAAVLGALVWLGIGLSACRTSTEDIQRWANTSQGPRKLIAVVNHDKYPLDLRVEAAMTLISMKPRGGRRIGIQGQDDQPGLIEVLSALPHQERAAIIQRVVPRLLLEMKKEPKPAEEGHAPIDTTFPYKDTAFALLTHEDALIVDAKLREGLREALIAWAAADFANRMDESSQLFGMEQVLRELKADGVRRLPTLIQPEAKRIDRIAALIADLGDAETKLRASQRLVDVAKEINSSEWLKKKAPLLNAANEASKLSPTPKQFEAQLEQYREEELLRIFSSMRRVGGRPVVEYLLSFAQDSSAPEKRRATALAALEGNLARDNAEQREVVLALATGPDTPDSVRDVALLRAGEMPREAVVDKLYPLFENENWKVRWVAAELVLKMSQAEHLDDFMAKLGEAKGMALTEPLRYGALIAQLKGKPLPEEQAAKYARRGNPVGVRLAALGYYYEKGTPADLPKVEPFVNDQTRVPECREDAKDCEWKCTVDKVAKDVSSVGQFVQFCVKPAMEKRATGKQGGASAP